MEKRKCQSHSLKISSESDLKITEIQLVLKRQLKKNVSKKQVINSALKALEERMGMIADGKGDSDEQL